MIKDLTTIIIPSRNEPYLGKTVADLLEKSAGPIEIIVCLDGEPQHKDDLPIPASKHIKVLVSDKVVGNRVNVNAASRIANGQYLVKSDAHCMFAVGWDKQLKDDYEAHSIMVPSRYSLDVKKWERKNKPPVEYLYVTYPYVADDMYGIGFHGRKWITGPDMGKESYYKMENDRKDIKIDEIMMFQGSFWFMSMEHWVAIDGYDERFDGHWQEPTGICFKTWLSGGRVLRNKNTWYAHWHKNQDEGGRFFKLSKSQQQRVDREVADYWMNNSWEGQIYPLRWLIDKFNPPGWPKDWDVDLNMLLRKDYEEIMMGADKQSHHEPFEQPAVEQENIVLSQTYTQTQQKGSTQMKSSKEVHGALKAHFRIKRGDIPPYTGWLKPSTREDLYDVMGQLGCFTVGAEVGVAQASNAIEICNRIPNLKTLYAVDPWEAYANWSQEKIDRRYAKAVKKASPYPQIQIIRARSEDAVKQFADGSLDFVYIDGFHEFDWVMMDLIKWVPKVRKDGIIAGHDYYPFYRSGVIEAVDVYVKAHNIREWYVTRERHSSFFWVK